jgi:8-oxo-dGTP diphosphatase
MYSYPYPRAALTVDALVFTVENRQRWLLLIERAKDPFKNKWALPGGFIEMNETLEEACRRELQEETGIAVGKMNQFKAFDKVDRDPRHRTISVVFWVELKEKCLVNGGDDAAHAAWFPTNQLPVLAFDHQQIIDEFFDSTQ